MYKILVRKSVSKDFRKLPQQLRTKIKTEAFPQIAKSPLRGKILSGQFRTLRSLSLRHKGTEYRVVYQVLREERVILIIILGTRENFYKRLARRLR